MVKDETFQEESALGFQLAQTSGFKSMDQGSSQGGKEVNGYCSFGCRSNQWPSRSGLLAAQGRLEHGDLASCSTLRGAGRKHAGLQVMVGSCSALGQALWPRVRCISAGVKEHHSG